MLDMIILPLLELWQIIAARVNMKCQVVSYRVAKALLILPKFFILLKMVETMSI